ncbi:MAG: helix-turn-helix transcriptional regulator [Bacteroidota bacterium]|nr:helix-turn-helix transcriptional regulator [Bacteroidota bacterium]
MMSSIGDRIRQFGLKKYGSINAFSEAMGVTASNLQQYLADRRQPGTPVLLKLKQLGCDINWLLDECDGKPPPREAEREDKVKQLEEENRCLRDELSQVLLHAQAICNLEKIIDIKKGKKRHLQFDIR